MKIEVEQHVTSVHIKIMIDADDWRSEVAFVYKRWEWQSENGPLFAGFTVEPAIVRTFSGSQDGMNPVGQILKTNIYNAIGVYIGYQLDQMFKTQDDFKRKVVVVEYGPLFLVRWMEE